MILKASMTNDRRDAGPLESQALQDFNIGPRSSPKRAQGKPTCLVQSGEIVDKSQDLDAGDRSPPTGYLGIVLARQPILRRWTGCSDLWPSLANEPVNSLEIRQVGENPDGENNGNRRSRTVRLRCGGRENGTVCLAGSPHFESPHAACQQVSLPKDH